MNRQTLAGSACGLAIAFATSTAMAQEIAIANESSLPRVDASGTLLAKRPLTEFPERIAYQDCIDDQRIRFTLSLQDFEANATVEAWASNTGQDCSVATNRSGAAQECWKLVDSAIPLVAQQNVDIPVRRILSGVTPFTPTAPDATANACGKVPLATVGVQLLYFAPGNLALATVDHTVAVSIDTVDPPGGASTTGVGCSAGHASPLGATTAVLGIAVAAFVRRRRR